MCAKNVETKSVEISTLFTFDYLALNRIKKIKIKIINYKDFVNHFEKPHKPAFLDDSNVKIWINKNFDKISKLILSKLNFN